MPAVDVLSMAKKKVGTVTLDDSVFGVRVHPEIVHEVLIMQRASSRQGTASTKGRGEVSGSGRKPWRQKGTGRARVGSIRSPLWRKGGTVFGPRPRRYGYRLPRGKSALALRAALSAKTQAGEVVVLNELSLDTPKTKAAAELLNRLGLSGRILIAVDQLDASLVRATRNLRQVTAIPLASLNLYDVLRHRYMVLVQADLSKLSERLG